MLVDTAVARRAGRETDSGCGRVYLATTQNELLRLHISGTIQPAASSRALPSAVVLAKWGVVTT